MKERVDGSLEGRASILDDNAQALSLALLIKIHPETQTFYIFYHRFVTSVRYIVIDRTAKCSMCSCLYTNAPTCFLVTTQLTAAKHDTNRRKMSSHKKRIDELCHFMRRKQIKVLDIKWNTNELLIPLGPQTDQLLLQPIPCIPNSHFTRLHTKQNQQLQVAHCHIGDLLLMEWWGRTGQCNTAGWLVRHLAYAPHCERRAVVRGADNGQNMCHGVEVGCQHCIASVSTRTRKTLSHSL